MKLHKHKLSLLASFTLTLAIPFTAFAGPGGGNNGKNRTEVPGSTTTVPAVVQPVQEPVVPPVQVVSNPPLAVNSQPPVAVPPPNDPNSGQNTGTIFNQEPVPEKKRSKNNSLSMDSYTDCDDEALKAVLLLLEDRNILGMYWELTAMRLAARALKHSDTTMEQMVIGESREYKKKIQKIKGSQEMQDRILAVYETYGRGKDLALLDRYYDEAEKGTKDPCYWCKDKRLWNESSSAYILTMTLEGSEEYISEADVATIWVVEKLRQENERRTLSGKYQGFKKGQYQGNLMNISTRVARYLGRIGKDKNGKWKGGTSMEWSRQNLKAEIADAEQEIKDAFNQAFSDASVQKILKDCYEQVYLSENNNVSCEDCVQQDLDRFADQFKDVKNIQKSLMRIIAKSSTSSLEKNLTGRIAGTEFDLSNFRVGDVKRDTRTGGSPCPDLRPRAR